MLFGVVFTALHLNLARFDAELSFRGNAHDDLRPRAARPAGEGRPALRAADAAQPQAGARLALDRRPALRRVLARADPDARSPNRGVGIYVTSRFALFKHALTEPDATPCSCRCRRRGFERVRVGRLLHRLRGVLVRRDWAAGWRRAAVVLAGALALRLVGLQHGLPYVYNADENAHFVPRAVGMFGHGFNPHYFVNPPAYTYLVHLALDAAFGSREAVGNALAADRDGRVRGRARLIAALLGDLAVVCLLVARAAAARPRRRADRGRAAGRRLPARLLLAPGAQRRPRAGRAVPGAGRGGRHVPRPAGARVRARRRGARRWPARPSTRRASCSRASSAAARGALRRATGRRRRAVRGSRSRAARAAAFVVANPYALLDFDAFRDGLQHQSEASGDGGGKLGITQSSGILYYVGTAHLGARLAAAGGRRRRRDRPAGARPPAGGVLVPAPLLFLALHGHARSASSRAGCCRSTRSLPAGRLGRGRAAGWIAARAAPALGRAWPRARALAGAQGLVFSVHYDLVAAPRRHAPAGPRLDGRQRPDPLQGRGRAVPALRLGGRPGERDQGHRERLPLEQVADHAGADSAGRRGDPLRGLRAHDAARR